MTTNSPWKTTNLIEISHQFQYSLAESPISAVLRGDELAGYFWYATVTVQLHQGNDFRLCRKDQQCGVCMICS